MTAITLQTLCVCQPVSEKGIQNLKKHFETVHYFPDGAVPADIAKETEVWYVRPGGLPEGLDTIGQVAMTRLVQLSSGE